jgi:hypothetical protein
VPVAPISATTASNAAPWWSALVGVGVGAILGAAGALASLIIQRRWQRKDKVRELSIARGEELLDLCRQLHEWDDGARKLAFTGESQGFIPTQAPMFRIAAIVELYFPQLSQVAQSLNNVTGDYRYHLRGVAMLVHGGEPLSEAKRKALREEQARFEQGLATFLVSARGLIGKLVSGEKVTLPSA